VTGQIVYLKHYQINKENWDTCIETASNREVYALSWYLDIVSPNWEAFVIIDDSGFYETVMPLPVKKQLTIPYLQQPFFCQQLGIFGRHVNDTGRVEAFLSKLKFHFSYVLGYTFNSGNERHSSFFTENTVTQYLQLNRSYREIYQGYNRDRKNNLKRAKTSGLKLVESSDIEPLIQIFKNNTAERIYGGVSETAYQQLRGLFSEFKSRGIVKLIYTQEGKEYLTGGLFVIWGQKIIYLFNASTYNGKKKNGNTLILNHVIKMYSNQNYTFDFESPSKEFQNIFRFYSSFGSKEVLLNQIHYNNLPELIQKMKRLRMNTYFLMKRIGL